MLFNLESFLPYRLHQAAEFTSESFMRHYRKSHGINRSEWRTIAHLGTKGSISAGEIARISRMDKSLVSRAVLRLEKDGLLERRYRKQDRRGHDLVLTERGKTLFKALQEKANRYNEMLMTKLGDKDGQELLRILAKLEEIELE